MARIVPKTGDSRGRCSIIGFPHQALEQMFGFFGTILLQSELAQCKQREAIARIEFQTGFQNLGGILEAVAKQVRLCQLMTSEGEGMITGITRFGHGFLEELEASGYEYVTVEDFAELEEFKNIQLTDAGPGSPYVQPGKDESGSTYAAFTPTGLPLWFTHLDKTTGVGDKGPMDRKNSKALYALSMATGAVILVP